MRRLFVAVCLASLLGVTSSTVLAPSAGATVATHLGAHRGPTCASGDAADGAADDVNGDGFADVAIGAPGSTVGAAAGAGDIQLRYGTAAGPGLGATQVLTKAVVPGLTAQAGDGFGSVVAMGFVDGDSCADVVVATPGDTVAGSVAAGSVEVIFGSANGLGAGRAALSVDARTTGLGGAATAGERFGGDLALTDLLAPGAIQQLAIGIPHRTIGSAAGAGAVGLVTFAANGDVASASLVSQSTPHVIGTSEAHDGFGSAVDFESDLDASAHCPHLTGGCEGLAVGVPGEDGSAGAVVEIYPASGRPTESDAITQDSSRIPGNSEPGDRFGAALDFNHTPGSGAEHLAIGVPGESVGRVPHAGAILVLSTEHSPTMLSQGSPGIEGTPEAQDRFGTSVLLTSDDQAHPYVVVGTPGEDVGRLVDAGQVALIRIDTADPGASDRAVDQGTAGIPGRMEAGEHFGAAVGAVGSGLLVGVPQDQGWSGGMVVALPWTTALRTGSTTATIWPAGATGGAGFGSAIAGPAARH